MASAYPLTVFPNLAGTPERRWLTCRNPYTLLHLLWGTNGSLPVEESLRVNAYRDRKLRLFAVACVRRIWEQVERDLFRLAVDAAEAAARGGLEEARAMNRLWDEGMDLRPRTRAEKAALAAAFPTAVTGALDTARYVTSAVGEREGVEGRTAEKHWQCDAIRDLMGNPYREGVLEPEWITPEVTSLAAELDFNPEAEGLRRLGDALERGGCTDGEVLRHLRDAGVHVSGCWVVDGVFGRSLGLVDPASETRLWRHEAGRCDR